MISQHRSNKLDEFTLGYIYSALWDLEEQFDISDMHPNHVGSILNECTSFQAQNKELLNKFYNANEPSSPHRILPEHLGHDYWLVRNGKNPDFLARADDHLAQQFIQICKKYGNKKIILDGDDIKIIAPFPSLKVA